MGIADDAAAGAERDHGRVDHLGECEDVVARIHRARADEDHRRFARLDQRGCGLDAIRIGRGRGERFKRRRCGGFRALREHIPRHFQRHRAAAAGHHLLKSARHFGRRVRGIVDALGPFHETAERRELVRHLMQMTAALAKIIARHLTGEAHHRLVAAEGGRASPRWH